MKLKICEIFESIQGEGPRVGEPSLFVRLSGCNLKCPHCDTKYSWKEGKYYHLDELIEIINQSSLRSVVITGGEPLIQSIALKELCLKLLKLGFSISIETNGTVATREAFDIIKLIETVVVSPKIEPFGHYGKNEWNSVIKILEKFANKVCLKFAVDANNVCKLEDILCLRLAGFLDRVPIYIQPDSAGCKSLEEYLRVARLLWSRVVDLSRRLTLKGYSCAIRFVPQQHRILFWDVERGI